MEISRARISGVADITDDRSALDKLFFADLIRSALQMRVIIYARFIRAVLINRDAAEFALEKLGDFAVRCRYNGCALRRHYINRVVNSTFASRIGKSVLQLIAPDAFDRNHQLFRRKFARRHLHDFRRWSRR